MYIVGSKPREILKPLEEMPYYGEIEELPDGFIIWKNTDTIDPITIEVLGITVTIARGRKKGDNRFYIQNLFYPKPKYNRKEVEKIRDETESCPKCRIGFKTGTNLVPNSNLAGGLFKNDFSEYIDELKIPNNKREKKTMLEKINTFFAKAGTPTWKHMACGLVASKILGKVLGNNGPIRSITAGIITALPFFNIPRMTRSKPYLMSTAFPLWADIIDDGLKGSFGYGIGTDIMSRIDRIIGFGPMVDLYNRAKAILGLGRTPSSYTPSPGYEKLEPLAAMPGLQGIMKQIAIKIKE